MSQPDPNNAPRGFLARLRDKAERGELRRFMKFAVVGASGVIVNMAVYALASEVLFAHIDDGLRITLSGMLAVGVSILTNFSLNDAWTWGDRDKGGFGHFLWRLVKYVAVASIAGIVQIVVLKTLVHFGTNEYLANFTGIGAGIGINYFANNWWTFRTGGDDTPPPEVEPKSEVETTV